MKKFFLLSMIFLSSFWSVSADTIHTVRLYSDEVSGGLTSDGRTFEDRKRNWLEAVDSASARIATIDRKAQDLSNSIGNGYGPDRYSLNRLHFSFLTGSLPEEATIESASFNFFGKAPDLSSGLERRVYLVSSNPSDPSNLVPGDYSTVGDMSLGVSDGTWNIDAINTISLNGEGVTSLNRNGVTSFALRGWFDFNRVTPTNENELYTHVYLVDNEGTEYDPYLEITYSLPGAEEEKTTEELIEELSTQIGELDLSRIIRLFYQARLVTIERTYGSRFGRVFEVSLDNLERMIQRDEDRNRISSEDAEVLLDLIEAIRYSLEEEPEEETINPPLITQITSPHPSTEETSSWANEDYAGGRANYEDGCGQTIAQCGCVITSLSMLARNFGIDTGVDGSEVNPKNMNDWLLTNGGYSLNGSIVWSSALAYLSKKHGGVMMSKLSGGSSYTYDSEKIDTWLENNLAVGYSENKGHYLLLTGKDDDNRYTVNDPFWYNTKHMNQTKDAANHVQGYGGILTKAMLYSFSNQPRPLADALEILLESPAELLLIDEEGRRVGYDPDTEELLNEIPNASYDREKVITDPSNPSPNPHVVKRLMVANPEGDNFTLRVIGTGEGEYTLTSVITEKGTLDREDVVATTTEGMVHEYMVTTDTSSSVLEELIGNLPWRLKVQLGVVFAHLERHHAYSHIFFFQRYVDHVIAYIEQHYPNESWKAEVISALEDLK